MSFTPRQHFLSSPTLVARQHFALSPLHSAFAAQRLPFSTAPNQQRQEPVDEMINKLDADESSNGQALPKAEPPPSGSLNEVITGQRLATLVAMTVLTPVFLGLGGAAVFVGIVIATCVFIFTLECLGRVLNFFGVRT